MVDLGPDEGVKHWGALHSFVSFMPIKESIDEVRALFDSLQNTDTKLQQQVVAGIDLGLPDIYSREVIR